MSSLFSFSNMGRHALENCIHLVKIIFNAPMSLDFLEFLPEQWLPIKDQPDSTPFSKQPETRVHKTTISDGATGSAEQWAPRERNKVRYTVTQLPARTQFPGHQVLGRRPQTEPRSPAKLRKWRSSDFKEAEGVGGRGRVLAKRKLHREL